MYVHVSICHCIRRRVHEGRSAPSIKSWLREYAQHGKPRESTERPSLVSRVWWAPESNSVLGVWLGVWWPAKLQALVYDILPSTTAVFSYAIGPWKLSANEQFFDGVQTVVSLLQTTPIKQGVSFIAANNVYTSTNQTTIVWIETELSVFTRGGCVSCLRASFGARLLIQSY